MIDIAKCRYALQQLFRASLSYTQGMPYPPSFYTFELYEALEELEKLQKINTSEGTGAPEKAVRYEIKELLNTLAKEGVK